MQWCGDVNHHTDLKILCLDQSSRSCQQALARTQRPAWLLHSHPLSNPPMTLASLPWLLMIVCVLGSSRVTNMDEDPHHMTATASMEGQTSPATITMRPLNQGNRVWVTSGCPAPTTLSAGCTAPLSPQVGW